MAKLSSKGDDSMLRINQCKLPIQISEQEIRNYICSRLKIKDQQLLNYSIYRKSLDARKKDDIHYVYAFDITVSNEEQILKRNKDKNITSTIPYSYPDVPSGLETLTHRPVVVGFGPAGMFSALLLAQRGYRPIVIERGQPVEQRIQDIEDYWYHNKLHTNSNVQFGEGGAGTFSDGKLTTRVKDLRIHKVLDEFVKMGAKEEIKYVSNPHIGTDCLRTIVKNIRNEIIRLGGEIHFDTQLLEMEYTNNKITKIITNKGLFDTNDVILAIGHSARDTFTFLSKLPLALESKPFAVGVRIEHKQEYINQLQYGKDARYLPNAEYHITYTTSNNKGVYSFCMCPGGMVVAASSEDKQIATNGMSYSDRNLENANSALLIQVNASDYGNELLSGMHFQEELEKKAFILANANYKAPCQLVANYLDNTIENKPNKVLPSYPNGVTWCDLHDLLPEELNKSLTEALIHYEKIMPGFSYDGAIMTAVETRTSSPIRILRNKDTLEASITGLYPCGEGAGYAGGIVSSAIDGIKCAEQIIKKYKSDC